MPAYDFIPEDFADAIANFGEPVRWLKAYPAWDRNAKHNISPLTSSLDTESGYVYVEQTVQDTPTAPTLAQGAAGALTGTYRYKVGFVTALGETVASAASSSLTVAAKRINLTAIPTGPDTLVTSRRIYRTTNGGSVYKLAATISDNTTTTLTDNVTDAALGTRVARTASTIAPKAIIYSGQRSLRDAQMGLIPVGDLSITADGGTLPLSHADKLILTSRVWPAKHSVKKGDDTLIHVPTAAILSIRDSDHVYTQGTDYALAADKETITWSGSTVPVTGASYTVDYQYLPVVYFMEQMHKPKRPAPSGGFLPIRGVLAEKLPGKMP